MTLEKTLALTGFAAILPLLLSTCAGLQHAASDHHESSPALIKPLDNPSNLSSNDIYHLLVAETAIHREQIELAIEHYLALAQSQQNPAIAERAMRIAIYGNNLPAATTAAQRWIELDSDQTEAYQSIAVIYTRQNRVEDALRYLTNLIEKSQLDDKQLFTSLFAILRREQNTDTIITLTRKIAHQYAGRAYALYLHALICAQAGKPEEALSYIDQVLRHEDIEGAQHTRKKLLLKLGRHAEALTSLKAAINRSPNDKNLRLSYARLLIDTKQYEQARAEFEQLYQASANDPELLYTLALLSLESGQLDAAEQHLLKLVKTGTRQDETAYYLGRINEARRQYDDAIAWYQQAHGDTYQLDARLRISDMLNQSGQFEAAYDYLQSMLQGSQPQASLVRIYMAQGNLLRSSERYQAAIEVYDTALEVLPGNHDLLYARALTAGESGRLDILEADLKSILQTAPDNAHALNALGYTLADQTTRYEEAYRLLQRAFTIMPEDPAIIDSFGWVNFRLKNYAEAIRLLRLALSRHEDSEIAAHLGEVLWVSGKKHEARAVWQKALEKSPDDSLIKRVMQRLMK